MASPRAPGTATIPASVANLANTIIGAGILGLPYAFMKCGYLLGPALFAASATGCFVSLHLLAQAAQTAGVVPSSFYTVASAAIPRWAFLIDLAVSIKCFGVMSSYLILTADLMPPVMTFLAAPAPWQAREAWVHLGIAVAGPLACFPRLSALRYTSMLSLVFLAFFAALTLASAAVPGAACSRDVPEADCRGHREADLGWDAVRVLPIYVFGFTCQQNIFAVVDELAQPSMARADRVIGSSVAVAVITYGTVMVSGFLAYGDRVRPDIVQNLPDDRWPYHAARAGLAAVSVFSFPLQLHPARKCALSLVRTAFAAKGVPPVPGGALPERRTSCTLPSDDEDGNAEISQSQALVGDQTEVRRAAPRLARPYERAAYWAVTLSFIGLAWALALRVHNLGKVMALVGATGSTAVSYVLPGAIYAELHKGKGAHPYLRLAYVLLCAGLVIMPVCLYAILVR